MSDEPPRPPLSDLPRPEVPLPLPEPTDAPDGFAVGGEWVDLGREHWLAVISFELAVIVVLLVLLLIDAAAS